MTAERPALRGLADRLGILPSYRDVDGRDHFTSDATREALVAALGHDASDESAAERSAAALDREARARLVDPVRVWREWAGGGPALGVRAAVLDRRRDYRLELELEDGRVECVEGRIDDLPDTGEVALPLPCQPPLGYHDIRLVIDGAGGVRRAEQRLVMAPRTAVQPEGVLGPRKAWGIWANLYAVRDRGDWGHGGLRELARLGEFAGAAGAAFVGINPLHAVTNGGLDFAPYSPVSRLYRNVLYLDPESVPELDACAEARAHLADADLRRLRAALESAAVIDHAATLAAMLPVLRALHACFRRDASAERRAAYRRYRDGEGEALRDFATWEVLAEHLAGPDGPPDTDWRRWPERFRNVRSSAVAGFRREHADAIDFRCWLQFELDRQHAAAAESARAAGCALGIYQDLALGSSRASADTWMAPELFAFGATVGAPPDDYARSGQDWGFPPFDPHRLRAAGYRPWARLLRAGFTHGGALRLDHAMSLLRLYWIPEGRSGAEGAYVAQRADELLGVLVLESHRAAAAVVAEDLGTVPPELPGLLSDWGLLRSSVLYFARDGERFRSPAEYPERSLATAVTHDLAPLAGLLEGEDLTLRHRLGRPQDPTAFAAARRERETTRSALLDALRAGSFIDDADAGDLRKIRDGVHRFLAATPAVLVGVALEDLADETEPVNLPGVPLERHRGWSRRMARPLAELMADPGVRVALAPLRERCLPDRERR